MFPSPFSRCIPLLLATLLPCAAHAAAPAAAAFFQTPQTSHVELSPRGGHVAKVTMLPGGLSALVVHDTADLGKFKVIIKTSVNEVITSVHWVNEQRIGFTVKNLRIEFEGNQEELAADVDGGNLVHLITGNWEHQQEVTGSSIKVHKLTADYAYFGATHDGSDDILVERYYWNGIDLRPDHSRLYRLNTRTSQLRGTFEGTQPEAVTDWLTDAHDVPRVATSVLKGRCISSYRQANDTRWTELVNGNCLQDERFTPLFLDGEDVLYVRANHQGYSALFRYDLKTRKRAAEPFISVPGYDFNGTPEIDGPSGKLLGIHMQTDAGTTYWLHPTLKADQARIDAALPATTNTLHCAQDCLTAPVLLVVASSDRQPDQHILYTRASGKLAGLGGAHPDIDPEQMGQRDLHRYKARDGRAIPAYVTLPPGQAGGPRPAVVLVHGGPYVRGGYWDWDAEAQFLASRGYVVIQPDYRGSTGYGNQHFKAGWKQWGAAMQDDLADAARWAVKQGWADPKRIGLMGASYGGYATLMGLIKDPELFRCGVEWAGVTDIGLMFSAPQSDASEESLNYGMRTLVGDPQADAALFRANSPLLRAAELKQPLLMAHGFEDRRVPQEHADRFLSAVKAHNANVRYITYNNEGHGWRHEENRIDFWKQAEAFLDLHLAQAK
ncbi:prolyl oligopeptidase family serine peptidase [Rugamonas sp. FT107W]|uniref:Prolyl oligopeptidase family serine peptidase n=1 Tax=Duganella vulcania TaxID=2692166 RepID=A0A845HMI5_9BURK|nr:S9 family peptidase [Duganella vulcania]MYN17746.1 prolyl oligopeptidase family serine peptidase [Duganella vulcania]